MISQRQGAAVTIRDVAHAARVSTATVSRVMNGVPTVAPELVSRVRNSAEALGYRRNAAARGLVRGRTQLVGVVVPDLANPYFHAVLKSAASAAARDGFRLLVADAEESADEEPRLIQELLEHVDGIILLSPRADATELRALGGSGRPIVCVNREPWWAGLPSVAVDEYGGALALCAHLLELGHRRVLHLAGPQGSWSGAQRWKAISDAAGFGLASETIPCGSDLAAGHDIAQQLIGHDVTAVIAFNDLVALGVLAGLEKLGVEVPRELSVAGFDDVSFAAYSHPSLTTVRTPVEALGVRAWDVLAAAMSGESLPAVESLPAEVVLRESVGPPTG